MKELDFYGQIKSWVKGYQEYFCDHCELGYGYADSNCNDCQVKSFTRALCINLDDDCK